MLLARSSDMKSFTENYSSLLNLRSRLNSLGIDDQHLNDQHLKAMVILDSYQADLIGYTELTHKRLVESAVFSLDSTIEKLSSAEKRLLIFFNDQINSGLKSLDQQFAEFNSLDLATKKHFNCVSEVRTSARRPVRIAFEYHHLIALQLLGAKTLNLETQITRLPHHSGKGSVNTFGCNGAINFELITTDGRHLNHEIRIYEYTLNEELEMKLRN